MLNSLGRKFLRAIGVLGFLSFFSLFILNFNQTERIEQAAAPLLRDQVTKAMQEQLDILMIRNSSIIINLLRLRAQFDSNESPTEMKEFILSLKENIPALVGQQLVLLKNNDCDCRKNWRQKLIANEQLKIVSTEQVKHGLVDFIHGKYMFTLERLNRHTSTLFAINSLVFAFFLFVLKNNPNKFWQLLLPAFSLLPLILVTNYLYFYEQNWFHMLLFNDYVVFGYVIYLGIVFLGLVDIVFNQAKITSAIIKRSDNHFGNKIHVSAGQSIYK